MTWEEAVAYALTLPETELSTSYGRPAVKVQSNGRAFLYASREAGTSFAVEIDVGTVEMLKETEPETYWQSPHYEGWPAVLVRYDTRDPERVRDIIGRASDWNAARPPVRSRKRR